MYSKHHTCSKPLEASSLRLGIKQKCFLPLLISYTILEVLANALWQEKEMRSISTGKEEIKLQFFCRSNCLSITEKEIHAKSHLNLQEFRKLE